MSHAATPSLDQETLAKEALYPDAISMPASWPQITHIDDILPHLREKSGIHAFAHEEFIVLRYTTALPNTFLTNHDLEARGLIFERRSGKLLSRTLHKFFNAFERQSLEDLDYSQGAWAEIKLDGSMIGGFCHSGREVFHTRGGLSEKAVEARKRAKVSDLALTRDAYKLGYTPVFEYTAPDNRVIINYPDTALTLLALRHRQSGAYRPDLANDLAKEHGVAQAGHIATGLTGPDDVRALMLDLESRTDIEGVVLCFPSGHRIKLKTPEYLRRHRILANISKEKHVYLCYLEGLVDDTASALGGERGRALSEFVGSIGTRIEEIRSELEQGLAAMQALPSKQRAEAIKARYSGMMQAAAFAAVAGQDPVARIHEYMHRRIHQPEKREALKADLVLPDWTTDLESLR